MIDSNKPLGPQELLGEHILKLIKSRGYPSAYQFWVHVAGDDFSRTAFHNIISGKTDVKFSSLLKLSRLLNITLSDLVKIEGLEEIKNED